MSSGQTEEDHDVVGEYAGIDGGGARFDAGKAPIDMVPPIFIRALAMVFGRGAVKYTPENWLRGISWRSTYACMMRHAMYWYEGEDYDTGPGGMGTHHLAQVAWNACVLLVYATNKKYAKLDDRPFKVENPEDMLPIAVDVPPDDNP
jgi:hypothetical protein